MCFIYVYMYMSTVKESVLKFIINLPWCTHKACSKVYEWNQTKKQEQIYVLPNLSMCSLCVAGNRKRDAVNQNSTFLPSL